MRFLVISILLFLTTLLSPAHAVGSAIVQQWCPYTVYCAEVVSVPLGPSNTPVNWQVLAKASTRAVSFNKWGPKAGVTIQCTRNPNNNPIRVTQLEFSWVLALVIASGMMSRM